MINSILMSPWTTRVVAWLVVAIIGFIGGMSAHKVIADRKLSAERQRHAEAIAVIEKARAEAEAVARAREQEMAEQAATAKRSLEDANRKISEQAARIARLDGDARRLRDDLRAYASGSSTGDSIAACQGRAGALGDLLAEGGELLVEGAGLLAACAEAHDRRAAEVSALLKTWPASRP